MKKSNHKWELTYYFFKKVGPYPDKYPTFKKVTGHTKKSLLHWFQKERINTKWKLHSITKIY